MVFNIVRMRVKGVPLTPAELSKATPIRSDISIQHESNIMGRSSVVAQLRFPPNNLQWPELLDCQLHSMAPGGMVLTGTEIIDGVVYGECWQIGSASCTGKGPTPLEVKLLTTYIPKTSALTLA